jgi:hypothetical protein
VFQHPGNRENDFASSIKSAQEPTSLTSVRHAADRVGAASYDTPMSF